jgi:hypothetical protein
MTREEAARLEAAAATAAVAVAPAEASDPFALMPMLSHDDNQPAPSAPAVNPDDMFGLGRDRDNAGDGRGRDRDNAGDGRGRGRGRGRDNPPPPPPPGITQSPGFTPISTDSDFFNSLFDKHPIRRVLVSTRNTIQKINDVKNPISESKLQPFLARISRNKDILEAVLASHKSAPDLYLAKDRSNDRIETQIQRMISACKTELNNKGFRDPASAYAQNINPERKCTDQIQFIVNFIIRPNVRIYVQILFVMLIGYRHKPNQQAVISNFIKIILHSSLMQTCTYQHPYANLTVYNMHVMLFDICYKCVDFLVGITREFFEWFPQAIVNGVFTTRDRKGVQDANGIEITRANFLEKILNDTTVAESTIFAGIAYDRPRIELFSQELDISEYVLLGGFKESKYNYFINRADEELCELNDQKKPLAFDGLTTLNDFEAKLDNLRYKTKTKDEYENGLRKAVLLAQSGFEPDRIINIRDNVRDTLLNPNEEEAIKNRILGMFCVDELFPRFKELIGTGVGETFYIIANNLGEEEGMYQIIKSLHVRFTRQLSVLVLSSLLHFYNKLGEKSDRILKGTSTAEDKRRQEEREREREREREEQERERQERERQERERERQEREREREEQERQERERLAREERARLAREERERLAREYKPPPPPAGGIVSISSMFSGNPTHIQRVHHSRRSKRSKRTKRTRHSKRSKRSKRRTSRKRKTRRTRRHTIRRSRR